MAKNKKNIIILFAFLLILILIILFVFFKRNSMISKGDYEFKKVISFETDSERAMKYSIYEYNNKIYVETEFGKTYTNNENNILKIFDKNHKNITPNKSININNYYRYRESGIYIYYGAKKIISKDGNIYSYDKDYTFLEVVGDYFLVTYNEKYGVLDYTGKEILKCEYDYIQNIDDKYLLIIKNNETKILSEDSEIVIPYKIDKHIITDWEGQPEYYYINTTTINDNIFLHITSNGKSGLIDINNNKIADFVYDNIVFLEEYNLFYGIKKSQNGKTLEFIDSKGKIKFTKNFSDKLIIQKAWPSLLLEDQNKFYVVDQNLEIKNIDEPKYINYCDIEECYDDYLIGQKTYVKKLEDGFGIYDFNNELVRFYNSDLITLSSDGNFKDMEYYYAICDKEEFKEEYVCEIINEKIKTITKFSFDASSIYDKEYYESDLTHELSSLLYSINVNFYDKGCILDWEGYSLGEHLYILDKNNKYSLYNSDCKLIAENFVSYNESSDYIYLSDRHERITKIIDYNGNELKIKNSEIMNSLEYISGSEVYFKGKDGIYILKKSN